MERQVRKVLVAGGGISGLSAAFYLQKSCAERGIPVEVTVAERSGRFGGKIETLRKDGFVIEKGPDSFLARKLPIIDLTRELGLEEQLMPLNPKANATFIVRDGRMHRMPPGLMLGIPTQLAPFMKTGLISPLGKARAALDFVLPPRRGDEDESLGGFLARRLGREVLERIAEPLLAGIYAGNTFELSLQATFPQFREAERKYGSLIRGMMAGRKAPPAPTAAKGAVASGAANGAAAAETGRSAGTGGGNAAGNGGGNSGDGHSPSPAGLPAHLKNSAFLHYKGGLTTLVDALVEALAKGGARLVTGRGIQRIAKAEAASGTAGDAPGSSSGDLDGANSSGVRRGYTVTFDDGTGEHFDAIILALPTYVTAELLAEVPAVHALRNIPYVSVANVVMAFRAEEVEREPEGSGFLVPRTEGRFITACTWTSRKWLHTAPPGRVLVRCYIGRSGAEDWQHLSDDELLGRVRSDLRELAGVNAEPLFAEVTRLTRSMPQYPVGHLEQVRKAREQLADRMPGIAVTGAGFHGVGLPDCIRQGKEAAFIIRDYLHSVS